MYFTTLKTSPVVLFTFLGMGPGPLQLGKTMREMQKLGKIVALNSLLNSLFKMKRINTGIFSAILGRGPSAFLIGKLSGVNPEFGKFSKHS